jgi:TfuA protein
MHDTVVFLGPSLPVAEARRLLDAEFLPPICRGDIARLPSSIRFIGIIDGEFFQKLAVSPKEIINALGLGIKVFGSSSMGALRAAETHTFGMVGIGRIFEQFRDGILDADDEVAVAYEPGTYRALSDPMVNLREALTLARSAGVITESQHHELISVIKARYFPHRSWRALEDICPPLRKFAEKQPLPDLKRDDARALLTAMGCARKNEAANAQTPPLSACGVSPQ